MGLENIIAEALPEVLTTRLDSLINWARKSSLVAGDVRPRLLRD